MHRFFEPLDERETMLLLTTLTLGGAEDVGLFAYLPKDNAERLRNKAQALLGLDREKRVALMVREMQQLLTAGASHGIERVDSSWIAAALAGESPRTVALVLAGLPSGLARGVAKELPGGSRKNIPDSESLSSVPEEVARTVRRLFEQRLAPMPRPTRGGFAFHDVVQLERDDLLVLLRDMGLTELGQAFVSIGKRALTELCRRLPASSSQELLDAVRSVSHVDVPDKKTAQRFLSRVAVNFDDTDELFQRAGLWRLARASLPEDQSVRLALRQRLPKPLGEGFAAFVERAQEMGDVGPSSSALLQDSILRRVVELSRQGSINGRWQHAKPLWRGAAPQGRQ